MSIGLGEIF